MKRLPEAEPETTVIDEADVTAADDKELDSKLEAETDKVQVQNYDDEIV